MQGAKKGSKSQQANKQQQDVGKGNESAYVTQLPCAILSNGAKQNLQMLPH